MKFITAILVLFIFTLNTNSQNIVVKDQNFFGNKISDPDIVKSDSWFAIDKGQHFIGSFFSTVLITQVNKRYFNVDKINSKNLAIGITFSFGLAKETIDSQKPNNKFSWKDLMADVAGIATAIAVLEIK
jgi:uncharacterized protein YfiM (DUF2279 family)